MWIAHALHLPELFVVRDRRESFPVIWSIIGAAAFVAVDQPHSRAAGNARGRGPSRSSLGESCWSSDMTTDYDPIAEQYKRSKLQPWRAHIEAYTLVGLLGDLAGKSLVDVACGDGYYTRRVRALGAGKVLGVDLSQRMVDLARAQEAQHALGIEYEVADARDLRLAEACDLAVAAYLLNTPGRRRARRDVPGSARRSPAAIRDGQSGAAPDFRAAPRIGRTDSRPPRSASGGRRADHMDLLSDDGLFRSRTTTSMATTKRRPVRRAPEIRCIRPACRRRRVRLPVSSERVPDHSPTFIECVK
jgi:SAM-dependent methyltransferase